mgnify:CR=1 FL=1
MYDKFFEQAQTAFKPMNELMTFNAKLMEEAAEKQKTFITDMVNDSMSFAKDLSAQKDYSGIYQVQKTYWEGVQEKCMSASTDAYDFFTRSQEKASEVVKSTAVA